MEKIGIDELRKNTDAIIKDVIKNNKVIEVITQDGNAIVMSETNYRELTEALKLNSTK